MKIIFLGKKFGKFIINRVEEFNFNRLSHDSEIHAGFDRLLYDNLHIIKDQNKLYATFLYNFNEVEMTLEFPEYTRERHLEFTIRKIRKDLKI